jgi:isopenicillin N synthase-like dioxygenase
VYDAKWRFFWPIGERPAEVRNEIPKTIPENFPEWESRMDGWGAHMVNACETACEMAALGLGLRQDIFTEKM